MKVWLERVVSAAIGLSAVAIAAAILHREFGPQQSVTSQDPRANGNPTSPPRYEARASEAANIGIRLGSPTAPIQILEFADFECPFCRAYDKTLSSFAKRLADTVAVVFIHFPLAMHRYAKRAAQTAECADEQGQFEGMREVLYANADSFSTNDWIRMGKAAGIKDINKFKKCLERPLQSFVRIDSGIAWARRLQLAGTPTVIVNGWRYFGGPPDSALESAVRALLNGKHPRDATK